MKTKVWWLDKNYNLDDLFKELKIWQNIFNNAKEQFRIELEANGDTDELIGPAHLKMDAERRVRDLEYDIKYWPRPI